MLTAGPFTKVHVTVFDNHSNQNRIYSPPKGTLVTKTLHELARAHLAVIAILESPLMSETTRRQIELFREELEREMAELRSQEIQRPAPID